MKPETKEFKTLISATGLTLRAFASFHGVTHQIARDWHTGRSAPQETALEKLRLYADAADKIFKS